MKRDFLLGGTKLPTGGAVRGAGGAMSPPVFMLKEALKFWEKDRTDAYNLKRMTLNQKRENSFAPVLLFNIVAKFGGNRLKLPRFLTILVGTI